MPLGSKTRRVALSALAFALAAGPTLAHHSYSMFDRTRTTSISGTVLTWEMVNPHSFLWVIVKTDAGVQQTWGLEAGGVPALMRAGIKKSAVQKGQKVSVELHPLRDGRTGGQLVSVTFEDGKVLKMGGGGEGAGPQPTAPPAK